MTASSEPGTDDDVTVTSARRPGGPAVVPSQNARDAAGCQRASVSECSGHGTAIGEAREVISGDIVARLRDEGVRLFYGSAACLVQIAVDLESGKRRDERQGHTPAGRYMCWTHPAPVVDRDMRIPDGSRA